MSQHPSSLISSGRAGAQAVAQGRFDADDLGVVCLAFTLTAASFLLASSLLDLALCATLWIPTTNAETMTAHQVAHEALPWSLLFTAVAGGLTLAGARLRSAVRSQAEPQPRLRGVGFFHSARPHTA